VNEFVLYWNQVALEANRLDHTSGPGTNTGPTMSSRALAIIHIAMHDAWMGGATASLGLRYDSDSPTASPVLTNKQRAIAVSAAAHRAIRVLYAAAPEIVAMVDQAWTFIVPNLNTPSYPAEYGTAVADHTIQRRAADRNAGLTDTVTSEAYAETPGETLYTADPLNPNTAAHGPFYGKNALFVATQRHEIKSPSDFAAGTFAAAYDDVYKLGGAHDLATTERSPEETAIGIYWAYDGAKGLGTPPRMYNQIARVFLEAGDYSARDTLQLLAQMNAAMADAGILAWREKYRHNYWRPITGIRTLGSSFGTADEDLSSEPFGDADPFWRPLGAPRTNDPKATVDFTPPFPAYPSGHATFGAAGLGVLQRFLESRVPPVPTSFDFVSEELDGVSTHFRDGVRPKYTRHFGSLKDAIDENALSRVYLGVHWRFDGLPLPGEPKVGGVYLGEEIAKDLAQNGFKRSTVLAE
jgi:hypothetical protein